MLRNYTTRRMECAPKPSKPPSGVVSKFAKACRFRSIGVLSTETPGQQNQHCPEDGDNAARLAEDHSDTTEEEDCGGVKVHPQPMVVQTTGNEGAYGDMAKLFDTVSALKLAYVQLQEAHIPYNPDKIRAADEVVVSQLLELSQIKRSYREKKTPDSNAIAACSALLLEELQVQEQLLDKLKFQAKAKDIEIINLRQELRNVDLKNKEMDEALRQREKENVKVVNPSSFQDIVKSVSKAIHDFAKPLIALMKVSGWDLEQAAYSIVESVVYSKRSHKKYAFEAYIAHRMFHGFSSHCQDIDRILKFDDPFDALMDDPHSSFAKFCRIKYLQLIHPSMEVSFFGNLDHRMFVSSGKHPRTPFYQLFVKMARWVWLLFGVAASIEPKVQIFIVKRGSKFSDVYMESVEDHTEDKAMSDEERARFQVEFMVIPGFKIGDTFVRSRVYTSEMRS